MTVLQITLRPGEKIFVNGAVIKVDRKVGFSFLNNVVFLLEHHVMKSEEATTPFKQLYFIVQSVVLDPSPENVARPMCADVIQELRQTCTTSELVNGLVEVEFLMKRGRYYEALKAIRGMFSIEKTIIGVDHEKAV